MEEDDRNFGFQPSGDTRIKNKTPPPTELSDRRLRKRAKFDDRVQKSRTNKHAWMQYAMWEESQKDFTHARSVWERALGVDYQDAKLWLEYVDFESRGKFVENARNVFDRATRLLPGVDLLWEKYIHMEEMLGNAAGAMQVYERWMEWKPHQQVGPTTEELYKNFVSSKRRLQSENKKQKTISGD